jgi:predicted transcriptional regulator
MEFISMIQIEILSTIRKKYKSRYEIAKEMGIPEDKVRYHINKLLENGLIVNKRIIKRNGFKYRVNREKVLFRRDLMAIKVGDYLQIFAKKGSKAEKLFMK